MRYVPFFLGQIKDEVRALEPPRAFDMGAGGGGDFSGKGVPQHRV